MSSFVISRRSSGPSFGSNQRKKLPLAIEIFLFARSRRYASSPSTSPSETKMSACLPFSEVVEGVDDAVSIETGAGSSLDDKEVAISYLMEVSSRWSNAIGMYARDFYSLSIVVLKSLSVKAPDFTVPHGPLSCHACGLYQMASFKCKC